jgi:regulator of sigma E protease
MHTMLYYVLPFLTATLLLVGVHELGHYAAARLLGIKVTKFSFGMGPVLWSRKDRRGCEWRLSALPLGGYVALHGAEEDKDDGQPADVDEDASMSYRLRPPHHRIAVAAAGPFASIVFGAMAIFLLGVMNTPAVRPVLGEVLDDSPAAHAKLMQGDRVTAIDGKHIEWFRDMLDAVIASDGRPLRFTVVRGGGQSFDTVVTPGKEEHGRWLIGVRGTPAADGETVPLATKLNYAVDEVGEILVENTMGIVQLLDGDGDVTDMSGPVGMAKAEGDVLSTAGFAGLLMMAAMFSIGLGVMNLVPLPILDGGQIVLCTIELVRGKPFGDNVMVGLRLISLLAMLALFAVTSWNDIAGLWARLVH